MLIPPFPDIPDWWHVCGVALVVAMYLLNKRARSSHIFLLCITQLPGVILHELAHLLTGILFRAVPRNFSLIPARSRDGWTLGSVEFGRVTALNAVPIALAPLSLIPLAYLVYHNWFCWFSATFSNVLLLYVTMFIFVYNALPSRQDLRVACNWRSLLLYGCCGGVIGFCWYYREWLSMMGRQIAGV